MMHVHGIRVAAVLVVKKHMLISELKRHISRENLENAAKQLPAVLSARASYTHRYIIDHRQIALLGCGRLPRRAMR